MRASKRAGKPKEINLYAHADGKMMPNLSIQCFEGRHKDCNGIIQDMGMFRGGQICECSCHKTFIAPGDIKYKIKRKKYPCFQNSLNRRKK